MESCTASRALDVRALLPRASDEALDLLGRLLSFNPGRRPSADEALAHPYLAQFHNPADEPVVSQSRGEGGGYWGGGTPTSLRSSRTLPRNGR
eukprot:249054-Chlamydomonas_euryale.AAC.12